MKMPSGLSSSVGLRAALLLFCTATMIVAPRTSKAQTPDSLPAGQQEPHPGGRRHMEERQMEMLTKHLSLTPDQITRVKAIDDDARAQMMALRDDTSTSREQKRPKIEAIHNDRQAKIKAILSDDQKVKFEEMEARMRERHREHREDGGAPPPPPPAPQS